MEKQDFITKLSNIGDYHVYTILELSKMFNCNEKTIRNNLKKYGLEKRKIVTKTTLSPNGEIENLLNQGYSSSEIAKQLNLIVSQITSYRNHYRLGADSNNISRAKSKIILTEIEEQVIIGSLLGDGCIDINNRERNYHRLVIKHGEKQEDYVWYKYNLLKRFCKEPKKRFVIDKRENFKNHYDITLSTTTNSLFTEYRNNWYPNNQKSIYINDFIKINWLGLAIWIMDDGYKTNDNSITLSTDCFNKNDIEIIKNHLESVGCVLTIDKNNRIRFSKQIIKDLKEKVKPYFIESMLYKLSE